MEQTNTTEQNTIEITLPDNSVREFARGSSYLDIAAGIGGRLGKEALAVRADGQLRDLSEVPDRPVSVAFLTFDDDEGRELFWHSGSHLMAQAVLRLFPDAKHTIGPAVDTGFYYDFDCDTVFTPESLEKIEQEMQKIVAEKIPVHREEMPREDAIAFFKEKGNEYKVAILEEIPEGGTVSLYHQGDFSDLCRGPHVPHTGYLKSFKLTAIAGAYWRGDSDNKMLQRIYGIAFPKDKMLRQHMRMLEEAKKRDHRKIGKELDLFSFHEEGPGFPFWHEKGTVIFNQMLDYIRRENLKRGYQEIMTPIILNESLWHLSGHWDNFKENMYFTDIDEQRYAVKPMNCPGGLLIFRNRLHSYRELPIKNAEMGLVHRHELSGVLHGLFRVRCFTQDDAHVFCEPHQIQKEVTDIIDYIVDVYKDFGFDDVGVFVATRPDKAIGSPEVWEMATKALKDALDARSMPFRIKEGEGAFYGPKIEFNVKDTLGRNWQCGTVQVDFSMPERFELKYRGSDGKDHTPVMIHRAIFGSLERFIGIIIEHYAGKLPLWLAPVQMAVLTVSEHTNDYGEEVARTFEDAGFRVNRGFSSESLGNKIRLAREQRVPYIFILGDTEKENGTVSIKTYYNENASGLALDDVLAKMQEAIRNKSTETIIDTDNT